LHSASCHACTFVSETSCERGNRYLDRALLIDTFECKEAAFFKGKDFAEIYTGKDDRETDSHESGQFSRANDGEQANSVYRLDDLLNRTSETCELIRVYLPPDKRPSLAEEDGTIQFRFFDENVDGPLAKGQIVILEHKDLRKDGTLVKIAAAKVVAIQKLVNPETDDRLVQLTMRGGSSTYKLKLLESDFEKLRPTYILDDRIEGGADR
jgi:hypothetical protein